MLRTLHCTFSYPPNNDPLTISSRLIVLYLYRLHNWRVHKQTNNKQLTVLNKTPILFSSSMFVDIFKIRLLLICRTGLDVFCKLQPYYDWFVNIACKLRRSRISSMRRIGWLTRQHKSNEMIHKSSK